MLNIIKNILLKIKNRIYKRDKNTISDYDFQKEIDKINKILQKPKSYNEFLVAISDLNTYSNENIDSLFNIYSNVIIDYDIRFIKQFETDTFNSIILEFPFLLDSPQFSNIINSNKLQIFDKACYENNLEKKIQIDYSILLDTNVVSDLEKIFNEKTVSSKFLKDSKVIVQELYNFDILPYCLENIINLCISKGSSVKINRFDKQQEGMFQNLDKLYSEFNSLSLPNLEEFIILTNKNIPTIFKIFNICRLFLIFLLQARLIYPKKDKKQTSHIKKREEYVLNKVDEKSLLFSTRMMKIMEVFNNEDNHVFFSKIRNYNNKNEYLKKLNNTALDLFICMMPQVFYHTNNVIPILYTQDEPLKLMFEDCQPDLIVSMTKENKTEYKYLYLSQKDRFDDILFKKFFSRENRNRRARVSANQVITHNSQVKKEIVELISLIEKKR